MHAPLLRPRLAAAPAGGPAADPDALVAKVAPSVVRLSVILNRRNDAPLAAGTKAPAITATPVTTSSTAPAAISLGHGTPALVNFWATWCPPCVHEMPELAKSAERLQGRVRFIGLASSDSPVDDIQGIVKKAGVAYDIFRVDGDTARDWNVNALPSTFLVDGDGVVRWSARGGVDAADLD